MLPRRAAIIDGSAARAARNVPVSDASSTERQSASGISATGCSRTVPAAHTSASMPP